MDINSQTGAFTLTAKPHSDNLILSSESPIALQSVIDGIELLGQPLDDEFPIPLLDDIHHSPLYGTPLYYVEISRGQALSYFQYELLNFLTYTDPRRNNQ